MVTCFIVFCAGCWRDAPPVPLSNSPPPASDPPPKVAELGAFDDPRGVPVPEGLGHQTFRPTNVIYMRDGAPFGWRIRLPCEPGDTVRAKPQKLVEFKEVMTLPAPGDWSSPLDNTTISPDGRIATTVDHAVCLDGWIFHSWSLSPHDPPGPWQITVDIKGYATTKFRVKFVATRAQPPTP